MNPTSSPTRSRSGRSPWIKRAPAVAPMILVAMALSVVVPASAQQSTDSHKRIVSTLLMSKYGFPTHRQLRRTGNDPDTNRVLTDLAIDRKADLRLRLHAMRALEYYPSMRSEEVLMTLLFARKQLTPIKRVSMRVLARSYGVKMLFELLPFLRDDDPRMRSGAAVALAEIDDGRVRNALMNALVSEPDIVVRTAIEKGLTMIEERKEAEEKRLPAGDGRDTLRPTRG